MSDPEKSFSKFLSLVLRHKPETIQLQLGEHGWAQVDELLQRAQAHGIPLTPDTLHAIAETNDKKRFVFSADRQRIRANQGHSVPVDLQVTVSEPTTLLFHGTAVKNIASIRTQGLLKGERHHVHLTTDKETAKRVGGRYGKPIVLGVQAEDIRGLYRVRPALLSYMEKVMRTKMEDEEGLCRD
jgi:putative RNA 2'-phosphotransferase